MEYFLKLFTRLFIFVCMCACVYMWLGRLAIRAPGSACFCLLMARFRKMCLMLKNTVNIGNHNKKWRKEADHLGLRVEISGRAGRRLWAHHLYPILNTKARPLFLVLMLCDCPQCLCKEQSLEL